ncbi:chemotaxis protein CheB [Candidatus Venteria ishoeyi]|uniref:Chemotaxis protein methyltransferase Cher2 n=1 Tax=Candidatus Venteria ishoeyi TaxID=1899563 RepID=A0A1H6F9X4_9GAMM|nr:chemotaxis protein CheB [Candidatus Venteria ishoeyi]SEH06109.1 Chemotaxis protein methyltransferase Cher2 [Candidatus Venteria ishoeyi]
MSRRKKRLAKATATSGAKPKKILKTVNNVAHTFPIVGIGASAGGLAAFEAFFSAMPADADPGMAFVLVQHLAPDHKSILSELVRRYTRMKVFEVEDGMEVQANCAYIIPPNRDMAFLNGSLQLLEPVAPRGQRLPIDFFFRSLAQGQRERAIGVVLSGTGSDGVLGVRAIKGEGGMVMAQTPDSTEYDGMPSSAIATGLVDYELAPADMPAQLIAYTSHAFGTLPRQVPVSNKMENALKKLFILLRAQTSHDFSLYKLSTIRRRVERRMAVHQIDSIDMYVKYMQQSATEVDTLFRDLLIGVTHFFRDPEAFEYIEKRVMPQLFADRASDSLIRIWVPGCASGEEAYSLAILLAEYQEARKMCFKIQIFATDIDNQAISTARAGLYPASISADISEERLARFFTSESDDADGNPSAYRIHKTIRDMLVFSEQDVIKDPPFSRLDLISCRNLLIYMSNKLQRKLIPLFHYALNPGAFLFLGTSETVGHFSEFFSVVERKLKLYRRKEVLSSRQGTALSLFLPPITTSAPTLPLSTENLGETEKLPLRELTEQTLLQQAASVAILVNAKGDILYIHGRCGMYLEPPPGEANGNNILKMAREGLLRDLTTALHKTILSGDSVHRPSLRVKTNGHLSTIDLTTCVVSANPGMMPETPLYLVILARQPDIHPVRHHPAPEPADDAAEGGAPSDSAVRIATLEQELQARDEYLQTTTEELETSNEELKSSNEEMQSINEELQSTNEELETSKEELQSVNEELATVNTELESKVVDLSQANNDMNNLLAGTCIGTIFVDTRLRILRFTPTATQIINLIPSDIGRPMGHITSSLMNYTSLVTDAQMVLDSLVFQTQEVQTNEGKWFTMSIQPYRTLDNVIEGVVVTFVDITQAKQAKDILHLNEERMRVALKASPVAIFNQDTKLRYTWSYNAYSGFIDEQILGKTDAELLTEEEATKLTAIKQEVLMSGKGQRHVVQATVKARTYTYDLTVEPLRDDTEKIIGITCASIDISEQQAKK